MIRPATRRATIVAFTLTLAATGLPAVASSTTAVATGGTRTVHPGESIQSALDAARPGDRIVVRRGTYAERLTIDKDRIDLVGDGAVLVPPTSSDPNTCSGLAGDGTEAGICVTGSGVELAPFEAEHRKVLSVDDYVRNVSVSGFEVRGFSGPNIAVVGADRALVTNNRLVDGAQFGALTAGSRRTRIAGNQVSSTGALHFIGICMDDVGQVVVADNSVSGYDVGLCVQTHGADVRGNHIRDTCIGTYVDPGIVGAQVRSNHITTTNAACTNQNEYGIYGIILAGSVQAVVRGNRVENLTGPGIALEDASTAGIFAAGNIVRQNDLAGNDPDLLVETAGPGNVVIRNRCTTSAPDGLCT